MSRTFQEFFKSYLKNDKIAIKHYEKEISYKTLFEKSNKIAISLKKQGVQKEDIIAVIGKRSIELVICVLGIIQAGGAYVIIDSEWPKDRIDLMLHEIDVKGVLILEEAEYNNENIKTFTVYNNEKTLNSKRVTCCRSKEDLLYIVFTSGTTGNPKAIMIEDHNLLSYIDSFINLFQITDKDKTLQQSPCYYDGFAEEIFSILFCGGTLIIPNEEDVKNPRLLKKVCENFEVTILASTPIMIKYLNQFGNIRSLRCLLSSGEVLNEKYYDRLIDTCEIYNMYGPSEATILSTYHKCLKHEAEMPIGKSLEHCNVVIYNDELEVINKGEIGNIIIFGEGVGRGYKNATENNGFLELDGKKAYYTGDYGRIEDDGNIYFEGRKDRQVKIRGNRVELEEISKIAEENSEIFCAAAIAFIKNNEHEICIFYEGILEVTELKVFLSERLPDYMMPTQIIKKKKIPLLENGKKDYSKMKQLLDKHLERASDFDLRAANSNNERFLKIIVQNLGNKEIIANKMLDAKLDELGVNSLTFVQLIIALEREYKITFEDQFLISTRYVNLKDLYDYVVHKKK